MRLPRELRLYIKTAGYIVLAIASILGLSGLVLLTLSWYLAIPFSDLSGSWTGALVPILLSLISYLIRLFASDEQDRAIEDPSSEDYFEGL